MAKHENLKVFTKFYDLTIWLHQKVIKFPKNSRFTLGQRVEDTAFETLELVVMANSTFDKERRLELQKEIGLNLEVLRILMRAAKDLKFINIRSYKFAYERILEVDRILGGWRKSTKNQTPPKNKAFERGGG